MHIVHSTAFMQGCVCWHTVSPGALSEVEDTLASVLITVMRRVSSWLGKGVLPCKRETQVQRLHEQHPRCLG